ncbi:unnamed protein product [Bursaphelenchus okinawaensis]|uniref:Uncharacterized protein n=1 Tax=Bursaphelenchus okinawaensis TaxID=465554 RepID=A0A811KXT3_9BILA|nr:unnamed protein product [Bursaphelenchus okinawaensis]CAG9113579.1 unnamed protein product [Bursaphelenchus okinawaensis]
MNCGRTPGNGHLAPTQRPYSNSVCAISLKPAETNRAHMHRASDGLLMSDNYRLTPRRESRRPSIQDELYYYQKNYGRHENSIFATVWASYIFVFIAVLITFSIVLAVGILLNSMTVKGRHGGGSSKIDVNYNNTGTVERIRDVLHLNNNNHRVLTDSYEAKIFNIATGL